MDTHGVAILPSDVERCGAADAVLLGAVGGPRWDDPNAKVRPEQAPVRPARRSRAVREPATGDRPPGARPVVAAPARAAQRGRHAHRPGADRRALLRPAVGGARHAGGPRRRRHALVHGRRRSRRIVRLAFDPRPDPAEQGHPGRQGQRAGLEPPLAQGHRGGPDGVPGRRARASARGLDARCSSSPGRRPST